MHCPHRVSYHELLTPEEILVPRTRGDEPVMLVLTATSRSYSRALMPSEPVARHLRMEPDDPRPRVCARRRALVDELLPKVRRLKLIMPDDQVLELAESMADLRLR